MHEVEPTVKMLMSKVDEATLEGTAGKLINFYGTELTF